MFTNLLDYHCCVVKCTEIKLTLIKYAWVKGRHGIYQLGKPGMVIKEATDKPVRDISSTSLPPLYLIGVAGLDSEITTKV